MIGDLDRYLSVVVVRRTGCFTGPNLFKPDRICVLTVQFCSRLVFWTCTTIKLHLKIIVQKRNNLINSGVCSFCWNFSERQILWSLCSVDFHTLTLQLPIQTPHSVAPELQVSVSSLNISAKRAHPRGILVVISLYHTFMPYNFICLLISCFMK